MKFVFLISILLFSKFSLANDLSLNERAKRASLSIRLANYTSQNAKTLNNTVLDDLQTFNSLSLTEKNDYELVKNALLTLLILDDVDPSRTGVQMVSESYNKNKNLFELAAKNIRTSKNSKQLSEILSILKNYSETGNG